MITNKSKKQYTYIGIFETGLDAELFATPPPKCRYN